MPKSSKRQKASNKHQTRVRSRYVIFISHSSQDAWIAKTIAEKIEAVGGECWLDEKDLEGGEVIVDHIIRGIDACSEAIVLISPNSIKSQWIAFEIGGVRAQHKRVTPIMNNVKPSDMSPMQDIKGIDLNKFDQFLAQLARRVGRRNRQREA